VLKTGLTFGVRRAKPCHAALFLQKLWDLTDIDLIVPEMIDDPRVSTLAQCQIALTVLEHLQYVRIQRDNKEHVFVDNALLKRVFA